MLLLLAPLAGAVVAVSFAEVPAQRKALVGVCCAAMLGGAAFALVRAAASEPVAWRGFEADAWTALLALAAITVVVAAIAHAGSRAEPGPIEAALFVAAAGGVAPLLVPRLHLLAVTLPISTLAFACAALVGSRPKPPGLEVRRAIAALAASDVAILIAIGTAVSDGTRLPPALSVAAGSLLLGGLAVRLGLPPVGWGATDALRTDPVLGAVWLGPIRAQGLLLLPAAVAAGRGVAYAAAAAASLAAVLASVRALREQGIGPPATAGVALATLGISLGGPSGFWGATLCIASFAAIPVWYANGGLREGARPTLGALPAGALLPGAALVVTAALEAAVDRPELIVFAIPALGATLALGAVVASSLAAEDGATGTRPGGLASGLWGSLGLAAVVAIAALPTRVLHGLAFPVADALGVGRLLGVGSEPGIPPDVALIMAGVAVVAFIVGPGRTVSGAPHVRIAEPGRSLPFEGLRLPGGERAWSIAGTVLAAASIGIAIRVYVEAAARGFL